MIIITVKNTCQLKKLKLKNNMLALFTLERWAVFFPSLYSLLLSKWMLHIWTLMQYLLFHQSIDYVNGINASLLLLLLSPFSFQIQLKFYEKFVHFEIVGWRDLTDNMPPGNKYIFFYSNQFHSNSGDTNSSAQVFTSFSLFIEPLLHYQFYRKGESICLPKWRPFLSSKKKKLIRNYSISFMDSFFALYAVRERRLEIGIRFVFRVPFTQTKRFPLNLRPKNLQHINDFIMSAEYK